jgi:hypothetical protein
VNRLTALEHCDERRDLLPPTGRRLRVVHAKGQRESVCALSVASILLAFGAASMAAWRSSGIVIFLPLP